VKLETASKVAEASVGWVLVIVTILAKNVRSGELINKHASVGCTGGCLASSSRLGMACHLMLDLDCGEVRYTMGEGMLVMSFLSKTTRRNSPSLFPVHG
jgi:hypothetical protein